MGLARDLLREILEGVRWEASQVKRLTREEKAGLYTSIEHT